MVRSITALIAIVLLLGCTSKEESALLHAYDEKTGYHKKLQKTEKLQLYQDGMTKGLLTATYLYTQNFDKNDRRDEVFIVGMHASEEAPIGLTEIGSALALNGQAAKEILPLAEEDERLKEVSLVTEWGRYYLVTFPHVESQSVTLVFKHKAYGEGMLHFAKVAKYVLKKEIF
ncbi:MAG TPA: hypothetical protein VIM88_02795 [Sulfurovum sp.]|uniref:hypothetical protein n=1 Tax=Sulfurovum sp. TaxID=1969726 RepID=UPI002F9226D2